MFSFIPTTVTTVSLDVAITRNCHRSLDPRDTNESRIKPENKGQRMSPTVGVYSSLAPRSIYTYRCMKELSDKTITRGGSTTRQENDIVLGRVLKRSFRTWCTFATIWNSYKWEIMKTAGEDITDTSMDRFTIAIHITDCTLLCLISGSARVCSFTYCPSFPACGSLSWICSNWEYKPKMNWNSKA